MDNPFIQNIVTKARQAVSAVQKTADPILEKILGKPQLVSPVPENDQTPIKQDTVRQVQSTANAIKTTATSIPRYFTPTNQPPPTADYKTWTPVTPYDKEIENIFGSVAQAAKQALYYRDTSGVHGENTRFLSGIEGDKYNPGTQTIDRGLFRINNATFRDFMKRKPQELHESGIYNWTDMLNPKKNIAMARIIYNEQGWGAWFGAPDWIKQQ